MRKLLVVDPKKRLTAGAALKHVWVTGMANKRTHKEGTIEKIKEFNARRKLKVSLFIKIDLPCLRCYWAYSAGSHIFNRPISTPGC